MGKKPFKLIIFDIDNTLFDSVEIGEDKGIKRKHDHRLTHGGRNYKMYARPFLVEFIKFCQKNFEKIALWTHADKLWLEKFEKHILPDGIEFLFKYDYSEAEFRPHKKLKGEMYKLKPLRKIYERFKGYNDKNTIIIEDTEENCLENLDNCIIVPEYSIIKEEIDNKPDIVLPLLGQYLNKLQKGIIKKIERRKWFVNEIKEMKKGGKRSKSRSRKRSKSRSRKGKTSLTNLKIKGASEPKVSSEPKGSSQ